MLPACLLTIAALLAAADGREPAEWVRRLGSDRFAERLEALRALEKLGPAALPALRAAKDSADPRIRARVASLLETLDRGAGLARLDRPTLIKLDFRDRPIFSIVDALNARHDLGLAFQYGPTPPRGMIIAGGPNPRLGEAISRRITLEAPEPMPFWQAIDRLCAAGQLQHDLQPLGRFGLSKGRFLLVAGLGGTPIVSDSGPLRVKIMDLHSTFERDLIGAEDEGGGRPRTARPFVNDRLLTIQIAIIPEPGLVVRSAGRPTFTEAIDDRGRSLTPPGNPEQSSQGPWNSPGGQGPGLNGPTGFVFRVSFRLPDQSSRSIRRLRGSIPVVIVGRGTDPIAIPLAGAAGKTVRKGEVTINILEVDPNDARGVTVEVEAISDRPEVRAPDPWNRSGPPDFVTFRTQQFEDRLELLDADGRELDLTRTQGHGRDMMTINRRIRLAPAILYEDQPRDPRGGFRPRIARKPVPVELRYYDFVQKLSTLSFDFHDVPLP